MTVPVAHTADSNVPIRGIRRRTAGENAPDPTAGEFALDRNWNAIPANLVPPSYVQAVIALTAQVLEGSGVHSMNAHGPIDRQARFAGGIVVLAGDGTLRYCDVMIGPDRARTEKAMHGLEGPITGIISAGETARVAASN